MATQQRLDVYDTYLLSLDMINQNERGQFNIDKWNRCANLAVSDFVNYITGRLDEPPEQQLQLIRTQKIADLIFPILRYQMLEFKNGILPIPDDYDYYLDLRLTGSSTWKAGNCNELPKFTIDEILNGKSGFRQVDVISHDEISSRVNSHIPLLKNRPCAEIFANGFSIYNAGVNEGSVFLAYVVLPVPTKLAMKQDINTLMLVYDQQNSIQPPFHQKVGPSLARKIAQYYFQGTRDQGGLQMSDVVSKTK